MTEPTSNEPTRPDPTDGTPSGTPSKQHGDPLLSSARDEDRGEPGSRQGVDPDGHGGDGTGEPA